MQEEYTDYYKNHPPEGAAVEEQPAIAEDISERFMHSHEEVMAGLDDLIRPEIEALDRKISVCKGMFWATNIAAVPACFAAMHLAYKLTGSLGYEAQALSIVTSPVAAIAGSAALNFKIMGNGAGYERQRHELVTERALSKEWARFAFYERHINLLEAAIATIDQEIEHSHSPNIIRAIIQKVAGGPSIDDLRQRLEEKKAQLALYKEQIQLAVDAIAIRAGEEKSTSIPTDPDERVAVISKSLHNGITAHARSTRPARTNPGNKGIGLYGHTPPLLVLGQLPGFDRILPFK